MTRDTASMGETSGRPAGGRDNRPRRELLSGAAAAALGVIAGETLGGASPAQATQGSAVILGQDNTGATARTGLFTTGSASVVLADPSTGDGVSATAGSGGTGVFGSGGSSGTGVFGLGGGSGHGVQGDGGSSSGIGVVGFGGAPNGVGVDGVGAGNGEGVIGSGGGSSGTGVVGFGGATGGIGVEGFGSGTGTGVAAVGGSSGGTGVQGNGQGLGPGVLGFGGSGGGTGVAGSGGGINGTGVAGTASAGNGVHGTATAAGGVGVLAENTAGGTALNASGPAVFSRSGILTVAAGKSSVTKTGVALTAASLVLATLQQNVAGVWVRSAVPNVAGSSFTVFLSKAVTASTTVAWFVVN